VTRKLLLSLEASGIVISENMKTFVPVEHIEIPEPAFGADARIVLW
jgi:hypothetical protein